MVFFTCSSCGESLKKNAVEKHFSFRCASARYVTCIDCSKDFWGNDYSTHTSCISEDQKYGSSNQVIKEHKGQKKQEEWINNLKTYLENSELDPALRAVFNKIIDNDNIPKKEKKFKNFLQSSMKCSTDFCDKAWKILAAALKSSGNKNITLKNGAEDASCKDSTPNISDHQVNGKENLESETSSKEKKKRKLDKDMQADNFNEVAQRSLKKLKKLVPIENGADGTDQNGEEIEGVVKISKKKKKNKNREIINDTEIPEADKDSETTHNDEKSATDNDTMQLFKWKKAVKKALKGASTDGIKIKALEKLILLQFMESAKEVTSDEEAKKLFKEHISSEKYTICGKIIKLK